ncbi:excinuclease ABC subunit UvrA [Erysipelothrix sp. HDW6C]|uniref:ATP-binding cassette domain-containing protein n=1 Tax=Erysipelothrix sp. HDW6C TaxID=2714930 RepID=UPI001409A7BA|nr:excinuclease ABC subunit UvrA [Erysipelothrix sp. HDW6C]QIK70067.1 excinuclease ABC subunit UvrA [Erysipelothrix sp. HDW6C]
MSHNLKLIGMQANNLRNVDLEIPKNKITVFTGVSGSGKSSIVFDTIANEATRQMNQTYSTFVQTFLPKVEKPDVVAIENLNPAIIIDQKRMGGNSRSTLGTITDIGSYLRLIFSRIGTPHAGAAHTYSFNDPEGMCSDCEGIGRRIEPQVDRIIDFNRSLNDGAILFPGYDRDSWYFQIYEACGWFDLDLPLNQYEPDLLDLLLYGNKKKVLVPGPNGSKGSNLEYEGVLVKFKRMYISRDLSSHSKKTQDMVGGYTAMLPCHGCGGTRYAKHILASKIGTYNIFDVSDMELTQTKKFLDEIGNVAEVAPIVEEALKRVNQLINMSLEYLTLTRETSTLSGGESQRVKMMRHLSSSLNGMLYIFDEPSVGLHPRDVANLNSMLRELRDKGNTVIVVEHDRDVIQIADHIIDVGPLAGVHGGEIMYEGTYDGLLTSSTLTGVHLTALPPFKENPRPAESYFELENCTTNNLQNITVCIPKNILTVVTGVAGSGKSSLIHHEFVTRYPEAILVDQKQLHASTRSNLMTYTGIFDKIRDTFAKANNVDKALFSFNSKGGCQNCKGRGVTFTDLAFMEGVETVCSVCMGTRYLPEVADYRYNGKNIIEVGSLTVEEAVDFFSDKVIQKTFATLAEVGVHYLTLGQPLDTLSGGECQRIKLASELHKKGNIYILDEPTTGLHMSDIDMFMNIIERLVNQGSTVIIIEHNIEVMRQADYIIDMGPQAGSRGGTVVYEGQPFKIASASTSITKDYIL